MQYKPCRGAKIRGGMLVTLRLPPEEWLWSCLTLRRPWRGKGPRFLRGCTHQTSTSMSSMKRTHGEIGSSSKPNSRSSQKYLAVSSDGSSDSSRTRCLTGWYTKRFNVHHLHILMSHPLAAWSKDTVLDFIVNFEPANKKVWIQWELLLHHPHYYHKSSEVQASLPHGWEIV